MRGVTAETGPSNSTSSPTASCVAISTPSPWALTRLWGVIGDPERTLCRHADRREGCRPAEALLDPTARRPGSVRRPS